MIDEMELKRKRIDEALAPLHNDMRVWVDGMGEGKIIVIFAYSVAVRVRLATGQVIDTTAFKVSPLDEMTDAAAWEAERDARYASHLWDTGR